MQKNKDLVEGRCVNIKALFTFKFSEEELERIRNLGYEVIFASESNKSSLGKLTDEELESIDILATYNCFEKIDISKRDRNTGNLKSIAWEISEGYVSAEYAYIYPPGVPLIVPGEQISKEVQLSLYKFRELGFQIQGLKKNGKIEVWIDA